jgi:hypothetical protein
MIRTINTLIHGRDEAWWEVCVVVSNSVWYNAFENIQMPVDSECWRRVGDAVFSGYAEKQKHPS